MVPHLAHPALDVLAAEQEQQVIGRRVVALLDHLLGEIADRELGPCRQPQEVAVRDRLVAVLDRHRLRPGSGPPMTVPVPVLAAAPVVPHVRAEAPVAKLVGEFAQDVQLEARADGKGAVGVDLVHRLARAVRDLGRQERYVLRELAQRLVEGFPAVDGAPFVRLCLRRLHQYQHQYKQDGCDPSKSIGHDLCSHALRAPAKRKTGGTALSCVRPGPDLFVQRHRALVAGAAAQATSLQPSMLQIRKSRMGLDFKA